jgi:hypothetical protein
MITTAAQCNVTAPAESLSGPCCHRWRRRGVDRPAPRNRTTTAGPAHQQLIVRLARENPRWGYQRSKGELQRLSVHVSATAIRTTLRRRGLDPAPRPTAATWRAFRASAKSRFVRFVPSAALTPVSGDEQLAWSVTPPAIGDQPGHFVTCRDLTGPVSYQFTLDGAADGAAPRFGTSGLGLLGRSRVIAVGAVTSMECSRGGTVTFGPIGTRGPGGRRRPRRWR